MANDHVKVRKRLLLDCLACPLCKNPYKEATTICVCLHTFCKECICENLEESQNNCCPVCDAYLGSFPEQLLRHDHNLCELVLQFFPSKTFKRIEDQSASPPPVNMVAPKMSRLNAPKEIPLPQNFGTSQDILRMNHDDGEFAKDNIHLNQTLHNSSTHTAKALKKQQIKCDMELPQVKSVISAPEANTLILRNKDPDQNRLACPEEDENKKTVTCKIGSKTSLLDKKNKSVTKTNKTKMMKRKASPFSVLKSDNRKIETGRSVQSGVRRSFGAGRQCDQASPIKILPNKSFQPVWFSLVASEEKTGIALPQIQKPYIRTMNGDLTLSFVNKYLVQKLNLKHESEVEVLCCGHLLIPNLTLKDLVDIWVQATSDIGLMYINGELESKNFVVELTYRSSKNQELHNRI
ncbi:hypothetical protein Dsin_018147 [Dipteronia sinensis]|uniref:RING-type domain-containing protein n=1 Tax=Dipteronia sinensis TaxID=43782 RepID=A0AAE0E746_9ROSI|nr:hypothetical protein Dsin_018147 [Dipteronia sinensis]